MACETEQQELATAVQIMNQCGATFLEAQGEAAVANTNLAVASSNLISAMALVQQKQDALDQCQMGGQGAPGPMSPKSRRA